MGWRSSLDYQSLALELSIKRKKAFIFQRDQEKEDMCLEIRRDKSIPCTDARDRNQDVHLPSQSFHGLMTRQSFRSRCLFPHSL